jgi:arylsulfatase A-like enzyme
MASSTSSGTALFAHLLLPHEPFALNADCSVDYSQAPWMRQSITRIAGLPANTEKTRILRYANYLKQLLCVADELERLLTSLEKAGVLDRSIVIVHGDHGPRISLREAALGHMSDLTERDVIDVYGTLFAYRIPGMGPSVSEQRISLEQALAEAVSAAYGTPSIPTPEGAWVWISSAGLMEQLHLDSLPP